MEQISNLIVLLLAAYSITYLSTTQEIGGPLDLFHKVRKWTGVRYDSHGEVYGTNMVSRAIICPICFSVWLGFALLPIWILGLTEWLIPFAVNGAVILLNKWDR